MLLSFVCVKVKYHCATEGFNLQCNNVARQMLPVLLGLYTRQTFFSKTIANSPNKKKTIGNYHKQGLVMNKHCLGTTLTML